MDTLTTTVKANDWSGDVRSTTEEFEIFNIITYHNYEINLIYFINLFTRFTFEHWKENMVDNSQMTSYQNKRNLMRFINAFTS